MGHVAEFARPSGPRSATTVAGADRARIVLAVVLIAQAPEGRIGAAPLARVLRLCEGAPVLGGMDAGVLGEVAHLTLRALAMRGPDRVLADLRGLMPRPLAETALALAIRAAFVEGRIPPETAGILGGLATHLGLGAAWLSDALEILGVLERPCN